MLICVKEYSFSTSRILINELQLQAHLIAIQNTHFKQFILRPLKLFTKYCEQNPTILKYRAVFCYE